MSFFSPHFLAQPPTFRDSQAGWRPRSGKSWELGIHSPPKPESDFVLAIPLKLIKSSQPCEAIKQLLYFILGVQEMLCFSRPVYVRVGGCGCNFQAWYLCQCEMSPSTVWDPQSLPNHHFCKEFMQLWMCQADNWSSCIHRRSGTGVVHDGDWGILPHKLGQQVLTAKSVL